MRAWLLECLAYRDRKTTFYRIAIALVLLGLTLYVGAVAIMLLHPNAAAPIPGR